MLEMLLVLLLGGSASPSWAAPVVLETSRTGAAHLDAHGRRDEKSPSADWDLLNYSARGPVPAALVVWSSLPRAGYRLKFVPECNEALPHPHVAAGQFGGQPLDPVSLAALPRFAAPVRSRPLRC